MLENTKIYDVVVDNKDLVGVIVGRYLPKIIDAIVADLTEQGEFTLTSKEHKNPEEENKKDIVSTDQNGSNVINAKESEVKSETKIEDKTVEKAKPKKKILAE